MVQTPQSRITQPAPELSVFKIADGRADVLIDEEDIPLVSDLRWNLMKAKGTFYAVAGRGILMHRVILSAPKGVFVDHDNHDGLDNRRFNLRPCNNAQNMMNRVKSSGKTSVFKGVSWHRRAQRWCAAIQKEGKTVHLGSYTDETKAAMQYDRAARLMFGKFALTNEKLGLHEQS